MPATTSASRARRRHASPSSTPSIASRIDPGYTLDPAKVTDERKSPGVIIAAANADGEIVRYFEQGETASYFGSPFARDTATGFYEPARESRMVASTGKIIAAIAIANTLRDTPQTLYLDTKAPARGLEACGHGNERHGRSALVSFACSLNDPLLNRTARVGQARIARLIDQLGYTMPPANAAGEGTPPSTAVVLGQVAASPRRVHQSGGRRAREPHRARRDTRALADAGPRLRLHEPRRRRSGRARGYRQDPSRYDHPAAAPAALLRTLLEAPLCYAPGGRPTGTLKSLHAWCAARRAGLRLHFAKTGTQVTLDPDATVDAWVAGGLQFSNGAAYSYVVVVGTGSASEPWAHKLHSSQVAAPLLETCCKTSKPTPRRTRAPTCCELAARAPAAVSLPQRAPEKEPGARTAADELRRSLISN